MTRPVATCSLACIHRLSRNQSTIDIGFGSSLTWHFLPLHLRFASPWLLTRQRQPSYSSIYSFFSRSLLFFLYFSPYRFSWHLSNGADNGRNSCFFFYLEFKVYTKNQQFQIELFHGKQPQKLSFINLSAIRSWVSPHPISLRINTQSNKQDMYYQWIWNRKLR